MMNNGITDADAPFHVVPQLCDFYFGSLSAEKTCALELHLLLCTDCLFEYLALKRDIQSSETQLNIAVPAFAAERIAASADTTGQMHEALATHITNEAHQARAWRQSRTPINAFAPSQASEQPNLRRERVLLWGFATALTCTALLLVKYAAEVPSVFGNPTPPGQLLSPTSR